MVETHSYKLSPLGPALQLGGGSNVISANSFCILLALVLSAFDILGLDERPSLATEERAELECRVVPLELCVTGVEPVETTGEDVGVWGPVVAGGRGGDTGTESDPRAPVGVADINHCILLRRGL